jgi:hypothetical protein
VRPAGDVAANVGVAVMAAFRHKSRFASHLSRYNPRRSFWFAPLHCHGQSIARSSKKQEMVSPVCGAKNSCKRLASLDGQRAKLEYDVLKLP